MRYYIFGASGFIGTHLSRILKAERPGVEVYNLDIAEPAEASLATYVPCDVRETITLPSSVPAPEPDDVVVNLAAVHRTPGHPDYAYFETNIRGAENVCAFAERYGVRRMVFTSSIAPYGAAEELKSETTLPKPNTPYGISKLVAEQVHKTWQAGGAERRLTILRPGVVFGLGENGNFTRLYWSIRKHKFAFPGRKDTIKACVYVKDLVHFMLHCVETQGVGVEIYNCTYEPAFTVEQIVHHMKRVGGLTQWTPLIPRWLIMPAAYVAAVLGSPLGICPARVRKLMISTNIDGKKMASSSYAMRYPIDAALADWLADSGGEGMK